MTGYFSTLILATLDQQGMHLAAAIHRDDAAAALNWLRVMTCEIEARCELDAVQAASVRAIGLILHKALENSGG